MSPKLKLFGVPVWIWGLILLGLWLGVTSCFWWLYPAPSSGQSGINSGIVGDTFGAVNALFSGLAFFGFLYTIAQQREEKKEEDFEKRLFHLIEVHEKYLSDFKPTMFNERRINCFGVIAREALLVIYTDMDSRFKNYHIIVTKPENPTSLKVIQEYYEPVYDEAKPRLYIYFESIYQMLHWVDKTKAPICKYEYINLIKSHLAPHELTLLFYHGLREREENRLKPLIEKYGLFHDIYCQNLWNPEHKSFYADSAYIEKVPCKESHGR